jgi:hypothetical protein
MRTTVNLADDVAAAVEKMRRERSLGLSDAVNELLRRGLAVAPVQPPFEQVTHDLGVGVDYSNVWEAIETVDGPATR